MNALGLYSRWCDALAVAYALASETGRRHRVSLLSLVNADVWTVSEVTA